MIACVDVDYREVGAVAACVCFRAWSDGKSASETIGPDPRCGAVPVRPVLSPGVALYPGRIEVVARIASGSRHRFVEPPENQSVRKTVKAQQSGLVPLVEHDQCAVVGFLDVPDGTHLELDGGLIGGMQAGSENGGSEGTADSESVHRGVLGGGRFKFPSPEIVTDNHVEIKLRRQTTPNLPSPLLVLLNMDAIHIKTKFEKLGARAKIRPLQRNRWPPVPSGVVINVRHDRQGEFFDIQAAADVDVEVLDVQPRDRHLLLMVCRPNPRPGLPDAKDKLLCGHDERHWFVAGVPEKAPVSTVVTAKEALKPDLVRDREQGKRGKRAKRLRRKTDVFIRQGEWFFIPAPDVRVNGKLILTNEPISRGRGSKPHMCEQLYRVGGTTVYVSGQHPNGLTESDYRKLLKQNPDAAKWSWRTMARDPVVYVRGKITHPDHGTIRLDDWHRVAMNTENRSRAMASVAFLD